MKPSEKSYAQETADRLRKEGNFKDADVDVYDVIQIIEDDEAFIAALLAKLKVAEDALEKIDNMCDGDMCKFFDTTHHCSACRYLESCQTGVAHAALAAIREKGCNNGK